MCTCTFARARAHTHTHTHQPVAGMDQTLRACLHGEVMQQHSERQDPHDLHAHDSTDRPAQWQDASEDDFVRGPQGRHFETCCTRRVRWVVCGKRVVEQEARAHAASGIVVHVAPQLAGGGGGMSVRALDLCHKLNQILSV